MDQVVKNTETLTANTAKTPSSLEPGKSSPDILSTVQPPCTTMHTTYIMDTPHTPHMLSPTHNRQCAYAHIHMQSKYTPCILLIYTPYTQACHTLCTHTQSMDSHHIHTTRTHPVSYHPQHQHCTGAATHLASPAPSAPATGHSGRPGGTGIISARSQVMPCTALGPKGLRAVLLLGRQH